MYKLSMKVLKNFKNMNQKIEFVIRVILGIFTLFYIIKFKSPDEDMGDFILLASNIIEAESDLWYLPEE